LVPVENDGGDNHARYEIGLRFVSKKGNQNGDRYCAGNGTERDVPPFPNDPHKDQKFNEDWDGRYGKVKTQCSRNALSTLKPEKNRENVAEKGTQSCKGYPEVT
jgi:hypothetical protein